MNKDAIGRRKRTVRQPLGKTIQREERDDRLLRGLRRHSPLPTPLAFELARGDGKAHYNSFQDRLTKLTHGAEAFPPLVERPIELNPHGLNPEPAWYQLSPDGDAIAWADSRAPRIPKRDQMHHRGMGACVTASFEILAPSRGLTFVHHEDMLTHEKCPAETRLAANPLLLDGYEPDALFGLRRQDNKTAFFVAEFDRGTESFMRDDKLQTSISSKLDRLLRIFDSRSYARHWGIKNLHALFLFTAERRIDTAMRYLEGKRHAERFLFKSLPTFARYSWRAPRKPIEELFAPWQTVKGPVDLAQ